MSSSDSRASREESDGLRQLLRAFERAGSSDALGAYRRLSERIASPAFRRQVGLRG